MSEEGNKLEVKVQAATDEVSSLNDKLDTLNTRLETSRKVIIGLIISVAFDVLLSCGLFYAFHTTDSAQHKAQNAIEQVIIQRTEARKVQCDNDNRLFITSHNKLVDSVEAAAQVAVSPPPGIVLTPEQQAQADKFVRDYIATIEIARVPLRDCTPQGIEAYYKE